MVSRVGATVKKFPVYPVLYTVLTSLIILLSVLILQRLSILPLFPFQIAANPTPTPVKVILNYSNTQHNFSVKYPQYWVESEPEEVIVAFIHPMYERPKAPFATSININATDIPPEQANLDLDDFILEGEKRHIESSENYQRISLEQRTISGLPAVVLAWSRNLENQITTRQAAFFKNNKVYIITYSALKEFDAEDVSSFDLVTSTFKFKD